MIIYTIGFTKKTAELFFKPLKENGIEILIDVRLSNKSQLAGFTKAGDIEFFLENICNCRYIHCDEFAPSKDLLKDYQAGKVSWDEYVNAFNNIMDKRGVCKRFYEKFSKFEKVCLLCSEATPEHCHRRLVAERVQAANPKNVQVIHL